MKKSRSCIFLYIIIGLLGSALFIYAGYLFAGALMMSQNMGLSNGILSVLSKPFDKYINNYTPIMMLLGFIIFESFFALFIFTRKKDKAEDISEYNPDIIDMVDLSDVKSDKNVDIDDADLFSGAGISASEKSTGSEKKNFVSPIQKSDNDNMVSKHKTDDSSAEKDDKLSFGSEIMDEMLGEHYTLDQMIAMISIKKYMKDVNADLLKRMFNPDMSPEEITSYISLFYE